MSEHDEASRAYEARDYERCHELYLALVERERAALDPGDPAREEALRGLSKVLRRLGRYAESLPVLAETVALYEAAHGSAHPPLGLVLDQLAAAISRVHPERQSEVKRLEARAAAIRAGRR